MKKILNLPIAMFLLSSGLSYGNTPSHEETSEEEKLHEGFILQLEEALMILTQQEEAAEKEKK